CIPRAVDAYNLILGNDALQRLPLWALNYQSRTFLVGDEPIPILTSAPGPDTMTDPIPIRASTTTILPPASETMVPCYIATTVPQHMTMLSSANVLQEDHLFVAPAVFSSDQPRVLMSNPTGMPKIVFKDQHLSSAEQIDLSHAEVTDDQRQRLRDLFAEYQDRISTSSYDLGSYEHSVIHIKTTTEMPPSRYRPIRIPTRFQKELDDHINKLLKAGRIVESDTPWVHNTVLVKKKDGSLRVCLDFRPLNDVTIPDHYPLPRIEDLLARVAGNRYYTALDLASGYMQLLLAPESQAKCGWATHRGIYQFVYLPFGLRNAGAYFSRAMSRILAGLENNCLAYLDDIIIFDKDFDSHIESLRKVFERFRIFNIKVAGKKMTNIAQSHITFLGHEISKDSYSPAERNVRAIKECPVPKTVKDVKGFIGMANFFRKFIKNFASIAAPLYDITKPSVKFEWGEAQQSAFDTIKTALTSKPCLAFPKDADFFLHTDGSKIAVGAALLQRLDDNKTFAPVGFFSKSLSDSQKKWSPTHIELFAMISALRFFRPIIYVGPKMPISLLTEPPRQKISSSSHSASSPP
ncbi:reverse transcriptase, partial [Oesophagostomum dentatum]